MYPNKEKTILLVFLIICVPYDVSIIILISINPSHIGKKVTTFHYLPSTYAIAFRKCVLNPSEKRARPCR
jgi:hypothetical protein